MSRLGAGCAAFLSAFFITSAAFAQSCQVQVVQRGLRPMLQAPSLSVEECPRPPRCPSLAECVERARKTCVGSAEGGHILGDIVTMRDPQAVTVTDKAAGRALAAAYLSQDPTTAATILAPFQTSADPAIRYLTRLAVIEVRLRSGVDPQAVMADVEALDRDPVSFSTADVDYLSSLGFASAGRHEEARDAAARALALEPAFFNARLLHLHVSLTLLGRDIGAPQACRKGLGDVTDSLDALMQLAPCPIQAAYVDAALELDLPQVSASPGRTLTRLALAALAENPRATTTHLTTLRSAVDSEGSQNRCLQDMLREGEAIAALTMVAGEVKP